MTIIGCVKFSLNDMVMGRPVYEQHNWEVKLSPYGNCSPCGANA